MTSTIAMPETRPNETLAVRVAVARFFDRRRADDAAARIAQHVPERAVELTATGLTPAQPLTSSFNYWDAAMDGLRVGAVFGALFAGVWSLTGLADGSAGIIGPILGAIVGALFGAVLAMVGHWGESDPERAADLVRAEEFHILVDERYEHAARAALNSGRRNSSGRFARSRSRS